MPSVEVADAVQLFNLASDKFSSISPWNAMIHGYAHMSLELQKTGIKPNLITFIGVLNACCHTGMVAEGKQHFESMMREFGIQPTIKHYGCMVDLLGRAGYMEEVEQLLTVMPIKTDKVLWGSILSAARAQGNVGLGEKAVEEFAKLDETHGASKVALSNIYADAGRWTNVSVVRKRNSRMKIWRENEEAVALYSYRIKHFFNFISNSQLMMAASFFVCYSSFLLKTRCPLFLLKQKARLNVQ